MDTPSAPRLFTGSIAVRYALAALMLSFYGGEVCPYMESLPRAGIGVILLAALLPGFALRPFFVRRYVLAAGRFRQPALQFRLDFALLLAMGILTGIFNTLRFGFPLASGGLLMVGTTAVGFFIALEQSLLREADAIRTAPAWPIMAPPRRLVPMTRQFLGLTLVTLAATTAILALMWTHDLPMDMMQSTMGGADAAALSSFFGSATSELAIVAGVLALAIMNLLYRFSRNMHALFENQTRVLERVSGGDLSSLVPVATADEFGVIAWHTNSMIEGLRHRLHLLSALKLAEEVQQNLLPHAAPVVPGLEVAAVSAYSEETGGDYYDFWVTPGGGLGLAVGDVAGHGVAAALLMSAVRAMVRTLTAQGADLAATASGVNRLISRDLYETGGFVTMLFLVLEPDTRAIRWVRAGHDPVLVLDPATGEFFELDSPGMAIGITEDTAYAMASRMLPKGALCLIGTDGIWETHSPEGELYGKERLREVVREAAHLPAAAIAQAVMDSVHAFRRNLPQADDITLVIVRLL